MNIREAKDEIMRSVEIYLDKNEFGEYNIPYMKQRPIFIIGAPGIGKTAIMEQVAAEMDLALVSYSMTHHTRQSALGLPFLSEKQFGGETAMVSEYTMSEIIASVYQIMEESGKKEGILFLDEINCVSETLAPAMLLFLQYKTFGNRRLPEGWVIVTAGNPPQYNRSVREFDVATLDRLKYITVEGDFGVWKAYAYQNGIHAAILAFLEINHDWFYSIKSTVDGAQYVTARGWEDLSRAICLYEKKNFKVDKNLIQQYITDTDAARKFSIYYDLFQKYQASYQTEGILRGTPLEGVTERAAKAGFDERVSLLGLLIEKLNVQFVRAASREAVLERVAKILRQVKKEMKISGTALPQAIGKYCGALRLEREQKKAANSLDARQTGEFRDMLDILGRYMEKYTQFQPVKKDFEDSVKKHEKQVKETKQYLENVFRFIEQAWGNGQEMILFMTELTANADSMSFIGMWGCDPYFKYSQDLLVYDVHRDLKEEITKFML